MRKTILMLFFSALTLNSKQCLAQQYFKTSIGLLTNNFSIIPSEYNAQDSREYWGGSSQFKSGTQLSFAYLGKMKRAFTFNPEINISYNYNQLSFKYFGWVGGYSDSTNIGKINIQTISLKCPLMLQYTFKTGRTKIYISNGLALKYYLSPNISGNIESISSRYNYNVSPSISYYDNKHWNIPASVYKKQTTHNNVSFELRLGCIFPYRNRIISLNYFQSNDLTTFMTQPDIRMNTYGLELGYVFAFKSRAKDKAN